MSRIAKYQTQFSKIFTVTIFLWGSAEGMARYFVRQIKWAPPPYMLEYTDDVIRKLYDTADPDFYSEIMAEGWGRGIRLHYEPFVEFLPEFYEGKHVNVADQ